MKNLSPSSLYRRIICPGSHRLVSQVPYVQNDFAEEGTLAHEVAEVYLNEGFYDHDLGSGVTEEMIECAKYFYDYIFNLNINSDQINIEKFIRISDYSNGRIDCYFIKDNTLHIFDYKYGRKQVPAFNNWQMIAYVYGLKIEFPNQFYNVSIHVVQPRNYYQKTSSWEIDLDKLQPYFEKMQVMEQSARTAGAPLVTSENCGYCPARHICPAFRTASEISVDISGINTPDDLDNTQLEYELDYLKSAQRIINARVESIETQIIHKLKTGGQFNLYSLENPQGRLQWNASLENVVAMGELLGYDLKKPTELITPTQAKDRGFNSDILKTLTKREPGAFKLTKINIEELKNLIGDN